MKTAISLIALASIFGVLHFVLSDTGGINAVDIYKDLAHVFVGGLFGAGTLGLATDYRLCRDHGVNDDRLFKMTALCLLLAVGLTMLEVVAFFVRKT